MGVKVRALRADDRPAAGEALVACGAFTDEEVRVALEVLDAAASGGADGDYPSFVAEVDGRFAGYVCVGPTPLTVGTWHLYWICVHPEAQRLGVGRALQAHVEDFVRGRGGERLVLETSASTVYTRARAFYAQAGYAIVGRIPDFYRTGEDCVVYCRALAVETAP